MHFLFKKVVSCEFRLLFYLVKKLVIDYPDSALHIVIDIFGKSNIDKKKLGFELRAFRFFHCLYFVWQKVYLIEENKVEYTPEPLCTVVSHVFDHVERYQWTRMLITFAIGLRCQYPVDVFISFVVKTEILQNSSINKPTESYKSWEIVSFN